MAAHRCSWSLPHWLHVLCAVPGVSILGLASGVWRSAVGQSVVVVDRAGGAVCFCSRGVLSLFVC